MLIQAAVPAQATPPQRLLLLAIPSSITTILPKTASRAPCTCCRYLRLEVREVRCSARQRARNEEEEGGEEYGHNEEIAMLESYTESARSEALLVRATVDGEEERVLIFKTLEELPLEAETAEKGYSLETDPTGLPKIHGLPSSFYAGSSEFSSSYTSSPKNPRQRKSTYSGEQPSQLHMNADSNGSGYHSGLGYYPTVDA